MAIKNRKLFPDSTSFNQTTDCSGFCDPACPYNCYPYSDDYLLPPPPPPPPPLSLMSQEHHISPYVIILVALLASFFLIVSYYVIVAKSCSGWCGSRSNRQQQTQPDNTDEEFLGENQVDHPIWFITTIGLQQSIINSITICRYKKGEGLIEGTECSVCLSEFQQDETLRLLPKCNHAFHISCIDTWLRSHTNCPLCRAQIVNDAVRIPLISVNQNPDNLTPHVSNQRENRESATGLVNIQESNENRAGTEDQGGEILQVGDERTMKDDANSNDKDHFQKLLDCVDKYQIVRNDILKSKRRSSSMDSLTATTISIGDISDHSPLESVGSSVNQMENNGGADSTSVNLKRDGGYSSMFKTTGSSSIEQCLHKGPVSMKRSFSCGGRFFSSRQQNRSLNSILPS